MQEISARDLELLLGGRCGVRPEIRTSEDVTLSESDIAKLREAYDALRALAAQMRGFAYNETIANRALRLAGFDPKNASDGLFGIANTIDTTGDASRSRRMSSSMAFNSDNRSSARVRRVRNSATVS